MSCLVGNVSKVLVGVGTEGSRENVFLDIES